MALTPSNEIALGTEAVDFKLPDPTGKLYTLSDVMGKKGLLIAFICNHCPYVIHLKSALAQKTKAFLESSVGVVAINANDAKAYPEDRPEKMLVDVQQFSYAFPYLYDESQATAKAYQAACTPDFFLYNEQRKLVYHGQFDDSRPGNGVAVSGSDLVVAVEAMLAGHAIPASKPSVGCNIKWRAEF